MKDFTIVASTTLRSETYGIRAATEDEAWEAAATIFYNQTGTEASEVIVCNSYEAR